MEKGKKEVKRAFYAGVVKLAKAEHAPAVADQASEMWRRILRSFAAHPDGGELADGFLVVIRYFCGLGYWRGYRNAKRHYAALSAAERRHPPDGRQEVHHAIEEMLEKNIHMSAEEICKCLDEMKLSASFDLKRDGRHRMLHLGPRYNRTWASVCQEPAVKKMISRLRVAARAERSAKAWMKLSDQAFQDIAASCRNSSDGSTSGTPG